MDPNEIIGLVIVLAVTVGILIWCFSFARKMVKEYTGPLGRIADALEDITELLKRRPPGSE